MLIMFDPRIPLVCPSLIKKFSSTDVARVVGLQTDAVVVTETRLKSVSPTTNSVGLQIASAGHFVPSGLRTNAVLRNQNRLKY